MRCGASLVLFVSVTSVAIVGHAAQVFQFPVLRTRTIRAEPGKLEISESGVVYQSDNGKTSIRLPLSDIWGADLSRPGRIHLETYDRRKRTLGQRTTYTFALRETAGQEALTRFLAEHLDRPVVGQHSVSAAPTFEIPAYHRHVLGGAHGSIRINTEGIQFISEKPRDSRTWSYRDIETIGSPDPFHFRVTSFAETYTFDLKKRMPEQAFAFAWQRVYRLPGGAPGPDPVHGRSENQASMPAGTATHAVLPAPENESPHSPESAQERLGRLADDAVERIMAAREAPQPAPPPPAQNPLPEILRSVAKVESGFNPTRYLPRALAG